MNARDFPFRRNTSIEPVFVPATDVASKTTVPDLRTIKGVTSFGVDNAFPCFIRLVGTGFGAAAFNAAADGKGWIFGPGKHGPFSTQFPEFMSAIVVDRPGYPIKDSNGALLYPNAGLEIFYGSGGGGWGGAASPYVFLRNAVQIGNFPATQAITGSVSLAGTPSVTVSNFPASQPVTGAVSVTNFPASQAVTGTFWQATQPVSIAAPVAVTGTFWQATQPVSGTVNVGNFPATQPVTVSNFPSLVGVFSA